MKNENPYNVQTIEKINEVVIETKNCAGFWIRLLAYSIDIIAYIPGIIWGILYIYMLSYSKSITIILWIIISILMVSYRFICHAVFGQTFGKFVCKIRVVKIDLQPLSWKFSLFRSIPEIIFGILSLVGVIGSIIKTDITETFLSYNYLKQLTTITELNVLNGLDSLALMLFLFVSALVLIFHKHKRTFHDFFGDSITIKTSFLNSTATTDNRA